MQKLTPQSPAQTQVEDPVVLRGRIMDAAEVIARGEVPRSVEEALDQYAKIRHGRVSFKL